MRMLAKELLAIWKRETVIRWIRKMCGGILQLQAASEVYRGAVGQERKHKELDESCKKLDLEHSAIYVHLKCIFKYTISF